MVVSSLFATRGRGGTTRLSFVFSLCPDFASVASVTCHFGGYTYAAGKRRQNEPGKTQIHSLVSFESSWAANVEPCKMFKYIIRHRMQSRWTS